MNRFHSCGSGGIGRRAGFRCLWSQGRESSSLFFRTEKPCLLGDKLSMQGFSLQKSALFIFVSTCLNLSQIGFRTHYSLIVHKVRIIGLKSWLRWILPVCSCPQNSDWNSSFPGLWRCRYAPSALWSACRPHGCSEECLHRFCGSYACYALAGWQLWSGSFALMLKT